MRIIAGSARGRAIKAPAGDSVRPTTDRVKEALFNILQFRLAGARVLDLFAGSGNLGHEALSRGAAKAVFVERDMKTLALLRENVQHLGLGERSEVMAGDFAAALPRLSNRSFDLILADPPYAGGFYPGVLDGAQSLLAEEGLLVLEHDGTYRAPEVSGGLVRVDERKYGRVYLSFYQRAVQL